MLYTPEYQQLLINEHAARPWGFVGHTHSDHILELYREYHCSSILDYGCGQGLLAQKIGLQVPVVNYDPGLADYSARPTACDLVVCVDVLEHIEPLCLDHVLEDLKNLTVKAAYFTVCSVPAQRSFPDGRNLHLIQEPISWWVERLEKYFTLVKLQDSTVWARPRQ